MEENAEVNPYQMAILNKVSWGDIKAEQMMTFEGDKLKDE